MGGLFSKPSAPPAPPGPDPELLRRQQEQDERLEAQERESKQQIASRKRARRQSGRRLLLSDPNDPFLGVPEDETLGPSTTFSRSTSGNIP